MTGWRRRISALARGAGVREAATLAILAAGERLLVWRSYSAIEYSDTRAYFRLAEAVATLRLSGYDGTRVPGYPAFLALLGRDPGTVWAVQLALGWCVTMLLFFLALKTTGRIVPALVVGGLYNVIPGLVLFESNLLSETLASFLVVTAFLLVVLLDRATQPARRALLLLSLGAVSAWAGLARALFFALPAWLLLFVLTSRRNGWRARAAEGAMFLAPAVILLGGWLVFMKTHYDVVAPDVMGGYHLIQHTGAFFEYVPDEYADLRDTYLKYRQARRAERGDQTNAIWDAIPEMSRVTGLGFYDLSRQIQRLSLELIVAHPSLYLRSVLDGWIGFWKAPVYWDPTQWRGEGLRNAISALAVLGRVICWTANGMFLLMSLAAVASSSVRKTLAVDRVFAMIAGWLWLASILQSLPDHGDNPRFLVPLQMLVIFVVVRSLDHWIRPKAVQVS